VGVEIRAHIWKSLWRGCGRQGDVLGRLVIENTHRVPQPNGAPSTGASKSWDYRLSATVLAAPRMIVRLIALPGVAARNR